jgi:PucR family transcriptional regulator, purine catabolism regulatory protein
MPLTVEELTRIPYLRSWLHAGAGGAGNLVTWAHSIEIPRPWEWLEHGDLLMTVGLGIPDDAEAQAEYVHRLADVGASGVMIGADMEAPPLSSAMTQAAEQRRFPICFTAYEVPFVQISRAVAAASGRAEYTRLMGIARIYERARMAAARGASGRELLSDLQAELRCELFACDNARGTVLLAGHGAPDPPAVQQLGEALALGPTAQPGLRRLRLGGREVLAVPIPAPRPASLIAVPGDDQVPSFAALQQVATLLALELERLWSMREERCRLGGELLAHLLDDPASSALVAPRLEEHGLPSSPLRVVVGRRDDGEEAGRHLHQTLDELGVGHLLLRRDGRLHVLLADDAAGVRRLVDLLPGVTLGVSAELVELSAAAVAAGQARLALDAARSGQDGPLHWYGADDVLLLPRTVDEARAIADAVLGPVLAWDAEHDTDLLQTLRTFLRCNRSWQRAAAALHVHKQTVVYRIGRIEQLTGRRLGETGGVSELWIALRSLELLE